MLQCTQTYKHTHAWHIRARAHTHTHANTPRQILHIRTKISCIHLWHIHTIQDTYALYISAAHVYAPSLYSHKSTISTFKTHQTAHHTCNRTFFCAPVGVLTWLFSKDFHKCIRSTHGTAPNNTCKRKHAKKGGKRFLAMTMAVTVTVTVTITILHRLTWTRSLRQLLLLLCLLRLCRLRQPLLLHKLNSLRRWVHLIQGIHHTAQLDVLAVICVHCICLWWDAL
jgi:hypothetical protein